MYQISIGKSQHEFKCTPSDAREMFNTLRGDPKLGHQVQFVETHYLTNGLRGYVNYPKLRQEFISFV